MHIHVLVPLSIRITEDMAHVPLLRGAHQEYMYANAYAYVNVKISAHVYNVYMHVYSYRCIRITEDMADEGLS